MRLKLKLGPRDQAKVTGHRRPKLVRGRTAYGDMMVQKYQSWTGNKLSP